MTIRWASRGISRDHLRTIFRDWFGIIETSAEVLVELFEAEGRPVEVKTLRYKLSSHRPLSSGALHERVSVLRSAMEPESVDFDTTGYFLTEVGFAECDNAVRDVVQVLSAGFKVVPALLTAKRPQPVRHKPKQSCETIFMFGDWEREITNAVASCQTSRTVAHA